MPALGPAPARSRLILGIVLAVSAGLRMWYWASVRDTFLYTVPFLDSSTYDVWARALASGDWGRGEPYWMGPLYPHLLALSYAVFGPGSGAAMLGQWGLTLLNIALVYKLGRRWLGGSGALIAVVLYAGYGPPVFYAGLRLMETVVTTLLLLIALQSWRAVTLPTRSRWFALGLLVGLCATARGSALVLLPLLTLGLLRSIDRVDDAGGAPSRGSDRRPPRPNTGPHRRRFPWRLAGLLWLGATVAVLPVTVRNVLVGGDLVILTSNAGLNLLIGQQVRHEGRFGPVTDSFEFDPTGAVMLQEQTGRALGPSQVSRELTRRAVAMVMSDPGAAVRNHLLKAYRFWSGYELPQIYSWNYWRTQHRALRFFPVPAVALTALGLAGVLALRRAARRHWLILVGAWFLGFLPFFPTMRFRLAVMPLLALSAAAWLIAVIEARRPARRVKAALLAAAGLAMVVLLWPSWSALDPRHEIWQSHMNTASQAADAGDHAAVMRAVSEAEKSQPNLAETPYRLGGLLDKLGDTERALVAYEEARRRAPGDPFVLYRRAQMLAARGRHDEALEGFIEAAAADPQWASPHHGRALALLALQRPEEAEDSLRRAAALAPGQPRLRSNLASLLGELGRFEEAVAILDALTVDFPGYLPGWFNLALVLAKQGETDAALQALSRAAALPGLTDVERAQIRALQNRLDISDR